MPLLPIPFLMNRSVIIRKICRLRKKMEKKACLCSFIWKSVRFHRIRTTIMQEPDVMETVQLVAYMHDIEGSNEVVGFNGDSMSAQDMAEKVFHVRATPVMIILICKATRLFVIPAQRVLKKSLSMLITC
ncbi:hypothetical protein THIOSC15_3170006 [uncultured Thiomicrorhabdus sp.]